MNAKKIKKSDLNFKHVRSYFQLNLIHVKYNQQPKKKKQKQKAEDNKKSINKKY